MTQTDFFVLLPIIIAAGWGVLLLLVDLFIPDNRKGLTALLAAAGLVVSLGFTIALGGQEAFAFGKMAVLDRFSVFLNVIYLVSGLAAVALAYDYNRRQGIERGEYYVLLLFSVAGMMLLTQAYNLVVVFLALELLSIPLYVLAGFARPRSDSEEASLKYFLLGTFSSAFVLYGIALIFGATAHVDLPGVVAWLAESSGFPVLFLLGAAMLLIGFGFKVAAVPFHQWAPDVYHGSPSPATAFMAVAVKAAGFAVLMRIFLTAFPSLSAQLTPILCVLAALTMIVGNVVAIAQTNLKRMLAYSSIAHAGYLLMAFVPYGQTTVARDSITAMLFYLVGYGITTLGAWALVIAMEQSEGRGLEIGDLAGLAKKYPWLAAAMLIFMLSLAGVPLTLGFWGKLYLFRTVVEGGFAWLALIGLLTALVSAYYYLRVVVMMYFRPGDPELSLNGWVGLTALIAAVLVLGMSFIPNVLLQWAASALLLIQ